MSAWLSCCDSCCARSIIVLLAFLLVLALLPDTPLHAFLVYAVTGVFQTESTDLAVEASVFADRLQLRPGMTVCEMGSANGALMAELGPSVMPGGKFVATSPVEAELLSTRKRVEAGGRSARGGARSAANGA